MKHLLFIVAGIISCVAIAGIADPGGPVQETIAPSPRVGAWATDPAWYQGKAEWALYDAQRTIYGTPRHYEATIFTNKQHMNTRTGQLVKADQPGDDTVEVFKHNLSEIIPTDNYDYRFLTTSFTRAEDFEPFKLVMSSQEDCGASYKQITFAGGDRGKVESISHCYFPETGQSSDAYNLPGVSKHFRMHDDLTLSLRNFAFDDPAAADVMMKLIVDQTNNRPTSARIAESQIHYEGRETLHVPYGSVRTHHLRVTHEPMGGVSESHYWFAADRITMRHVLVQYHGPYGVQYRLKQLDWWAYWAEPRPQ